MKKLFFFMSMAMMACCVSVNAQEKTKSIHVGFSPFGIPSAKLSYSKNGEKYKYDYKSYWDLSVGYEKQFKGILSYTEFTYGHATNDKMNLKGTTAWFDPGYVKDINHYALTTYIGTSLNAPHRLQFPLYIGIGGEYVDGKPFRALAFDIAAKARVKFYVGDRFGLFAGANYRIGFGGQSFKKDEAKSEIYSVTNSVFYVDAGAIIIF
jgi:hypothetical protein